MEQTVEGGAVNGGAGSGRWRRQFEMEQAVGGVASRGRWTRFNIYFASFPIDQMHKLKSDENLTMQQIFLLNH